MAVSLVNKGLPTVPGASFSQTVLVTGDTSYPNPAGYVFTPASFGLNVITKVVSVTPATVAALAWDYAIVPTYSTEGLSRITSLALHLAVSTTGVEVANTVTVATSAVTIIVEGN